MGRAFYRFGRDVALRLPNGQTFALQQAELGAIFGAEQTATCFLSGAFTAAAYRGLAMRGFIRPDPALQRLTQPVTVRLELNNAWAQQVGKDAATLNLVGQRLSQNDPKDELARKLLMLTEWSLRSASTAGTALPVDSAPLETQPSILSAEQEAAIGDMISEFANEVWNVVEEVGEAIQTPSLTESVGLAEAVLRFFEEEQWGWEAIADVEGLLRTVYDGQNGVWMCYTRILPELDQVLFYSVCPVSVPAPTMPVMTEYLCRVNADLLLGNFEIDFAQSSVRFRTGVDVTDVGLDPLLFRNLVYQNLAVMDLYLPQLMGIVAGSQTAMTV